MNVIWNKNAEHQWQQIAYYILRRFGKRSAIKFANDTKAWQAKLSEFPYIGIVEPSIQGRKHEYRSFIVHKRCKVVYYVLPKQETIRVAALWDPRRDPGQLQGHV